jgi:hypothetical protein
MFEKIDTDQNVFPSTLLYNEGWMLRLTLSIAKEGIPCLPFRFSQGSEWFSEALLTSPFQARFRRDPLAETMTHADCVVGHFRMKDDSKAGLELLEGAKQFIVLEAKMYSPLSEGTTHARFYHQAARNVACMAQILSIAKRSPHDLELGFFVLAPEDQIENGVFSDPMKKDNIVEKVSRRIDLYKEDNTYYEKLTTWKDSYFLPLISTIKIDCISWEDILNKIENNNLILGKELHTFYNKCKHYNLKAITKH